MNPELKKPIDRTTLKRVMSLYRPYRAEVALMLMVVVVGVLLGLVPPILLKIIIDDGLQKNSLSVVSLYSFLTILITLLAAATTMLYGFQSVVIGQKIMRQMRNQLFTHLQGMSLRFFTATRTGDIQTRLISDVGGIQNVVSNTFVDALSNIAIVISAFVTMVYLDWRLTALAVGLVPIFAFFGKWVGNFTRDIRKGVQERTSELNSMMQENLSVSGALLGKTIGRADVLAEKFDVENQELAKWQIKAEKVRFVSTHAKYNTAKTVKNDIMHMLKGTTRHAQSNGRTEPTDKVAKIIADFKKLTIAEQRKVLKALSA